MLPGKLLTNSIKIALKYAFRANLRYVPKSFCGLRAPARYTPLYLTRSWVLRVFINCPESFEYTLLNIIWFKLSKMGHQIWAIFYYWVIHLSLLNYICSHDIVKNCQNNADIIMIFSINVIPYSRLRLWAGYLSILNLHLCSFNMFLMDVL